jgi:hypothetical protein
MEQVGPQMWVVFRHSSTQGKQAVMDFPDPEWAQSFADGCNAEHKNPTRMSATSLRRKNKEHLTEDDKLALAALENGEGI